MSNTGIEYADKVWNPVTGCTPISEGCEHCWAKRFSKRLAGRCGYPADEPFRVTLHPKRLEEPLHWRKPSMIFVCSMGDLFHDDVPNKFIYDIWDVMVKNRQHTFLILSKRPDRMKSFIERVMANRMDYAYMLGNTPEGKEARRWAQKPVQNIWLGVTAENQEMADKRIPILLQIPAVVRFVSCEPLLGPIDLTRYMLLSGGCTAGPFCDYAGKVVIRGGGAGGQMMTAIPSHYINWIICGGETGPKARPMHPDWARNLRDQCQEAGVPFFFKQWGEWAPWHDEFHCSKIVGQYPNDFYMSRVGKKAAGRMLDGRVWNEFPK